jgi:hypothetical protein
LSPEEDFVHGRWWGSRRSVDGRFWEGKEIVYSDLDFRRGGMEDFRERHSIVEHFRISGQNRAPTMCGLTVGIKPEPKARNPKNPSPNPYSPIPDTRNVYAGSKP